MRLLIGIAWLWAFLGLGTFVVDGLGLPLPGSVAGMLLLWAALEARVVRREWLERGASSLLGVLGLLFVPAGVGLVQYAGAVWLVVVPVVAAAWVWKVAGSEDGLINNLVGLVRPGTHTNWLVDHPTWVLMMFVVWAWTGSGMLIFLAALQGIPSELREAAAIDGANRFQIARKIMLPLLGPAVRRDFPKQFASFKAFCEARG